MIAQGAHASMAVLLDQMAVERVDTGYKNRVLVCRHGDPMDRWLSGPFTKIVVGCNSEEELRGLATHAEKLGLSYALIQDAGRTEFHGEPTYTALAVGPDDEEIIDEITGELSLL